MKGKNRTRRKSMRKVRRRSKGRVGGSEEGERVEE
jgi:hypothetical protein